MTDLSIRSARFDSKEADEVEEQLQQPSSIVKQEEVEMSQQALRARSTSIALDEEPAKYSPERLDNLMSEIPLTIRSKSSKNDLRSVRSEIYRLFPPIKKYGLVSIDLEFIFNLMMNELISENQARDYIPFLLPRDKVPEMIIIRIFALLTHKPNQFKLMNDLLNWTVTVFELIDETERIRKLYHVLFHHLNYATMRTAVCHLLYFLTRAENIIPSRVRKLNELIAKEKENAALIGLLTVYSSFNPNIQVTPNVRITKLHIFEHPDPEMKHDLTRIQVYWGTHQDHLHKPPVELPDAKRLKKEKKKRARKQKDEEKKDIMDVYNITLDTEINLNDIQQLPYSEQLTKVLDDKRYQHYLVCNPDKLAITRLGHYIGQKMLDLLRYSNSADKGKQELKELIIKLLNLNRFTKAQLPIIEEVLKEYLKSWNGIEFQTEIFELITYIKPGDYQYLYKHFLLPLYRKFYVMDVFWKAKLIMCYTEWLKNWALLDWQRHTNLRRMRDIREQSPTGDEEVDTMTWMFQGLSFNVDYFGTIQRLIEHVDRICVMGLLAEHDHPVLQHASLSFFELVSTIPLQHDIPEIIIPAANFVHRSFFSSNAMAMSRICGILCQYKKAFVENDKKPNYWMSRHSTEYLNHFNTYVMDICNSLWRNMHLSKAGKTAIAFALTEENIEKFTNICEERGENVNLALSLTHSSALAGLSKRFMNKLERHVGLQVTHSEPITEEYLKSLAEQGGFSVSYLEYRVEFLNFLHDIGFKGIHDLLYACMTALINIREGSAAAVSTRGSIGSAAIASGTSIGSRKSINSHRSSRSVSSSSFVSNNSKIE